jgi:flagellin-like hook-associated protein FlgL
MTTTQVNLTAAINANLLSLQNTQQLLNQTQLALSTGKKVNSALDNPEAFFAAQALTNRSGDLGNVLDSISQGVQTIQTANDGITSITALLQQAQSVATQALSESNSNAGGAPTDVNSLVASFNQILTQITNLANDASYQGSNLINSTTSTLTITYDETGKSQQTIQGVNLTAGATGTQGTGYTGPIAGTRSLPSQGSVAGTASTTGTFAINTPSPSSQTGTVPDPGVALAAGSQQIVVNGVAVQVGGQTYAQIQSALDAIPGITGSEDISGNLVITAAAGNALNITDGTGGNSGGLAELGLAGTAQNGTTGVNGDTVTINGQVVQVGQLTQAQVLNNLNTAGAVGGFTASVNGSNDIVITNTNPGASLVVAAGAANADIGLPPGGTTIPPAGADSFSIQVGTNTAVTINVGGNTSAQLLTQLNAVSGISASLNNKGELVINSTAIGQSVTLANVSGFGLQDVGLLAGTTAAATTGGGLGVTDVSATATAGSLNWGAPDAADNINATLSAIASALVTVRGQASNLGQNLSTVQVYQSFDKHLINDLNTGSNDLTAADTNEESAALLTLQTQQQLGISALSLASQAQQAVLKLFP